MSNQSVLEECQEDPEHAAKEDIEDEDDDDDDEDEEEDEEESFGAGAGPTARPDAQAAGEEGDKQQLLVMEQPDDPHRSVDRSTTSFLVLDDDSGGEGEEELMDVLDNCGDFFKTFSQQLEGVSKDDSCGSNGSSLHVTSRIAAFDDQPSLDCMQQMPQHHEQQMLSSGNSDRNNGNGENSGLLEDLAGVMAMPFVTSAVHEETDESQQQQHQQGQQTPLAFADQLLTMEASVLDEFHHHPQHHHSLDFPASMLQMPQRVDQQLHASAHHHHPPLQLLNPGRFAGNLGGPSFLMQAPPPRFHHPMQRSLSIGQLPMPPPAPSSQFHGRELQPQIPGLMDSILSPSSIIRRVFSTGDILQPTAATTQAPSSSTSTTVNVGQDDPASKVGRYTPEERKIRIDRYRQKRTERNFIKKIKYACRKTLADSRPRIRGRFAKNQDVGIPQAKRKLEDDDDDDCDVLFDEGEEYFVVDKEGCPNKMMREMASDADLFQIAFNNML